MQCTSALDLLGALSPNGPHLKTRWPGRWVFRGHADESYKLVPTALRENALLFDDRWSRAPAQIRVGPGDATPPASEQKGWKRATRPTNREQNAAEANTLLKFILLADGHGLALPEDSQQLRHKLLSLQVPQQQEAMLAQWPSDEFLSLLALAQHYGLPTRLLDWSRNPHAAAYFAALGAAQKVKQDAKHAGDRLSVWALADSALRAPWMLQQEEGVAGCVLQVSAPAATNANLHAQQGLFSLSRPVGVDLDAPVDRKPLDELLEPTLKTFAQAGPAKLMWEFTLEKRHAPELLRRLALEGTSAARLFPGFGGIALALHEEQFWDLPGCPAHA